MKKSISLLVAAAFMLSAVPAFACGEHASADNDDAPEVAASTSETTETKAKKTTKKAKTKKADTKKSEAKSAEATKA